MMRWSQSWEFSSWKSPRLALTAGLEARLERWKALQERNVDSRHLLGVVARSVDEQDDELISAETGQEVCSRIPCCRQRDSDKGGVTMQVAEAVIDPLEAIKVYENRGEGTPVLHT